MVMDITMGFDKTLIDCSGFLRSTNPEILTRILETSWGYQILGSSKS